MENVKTALAQVALALPKVMLPSKDVDFSTFSVVACDQYSAQKEYWEQVDAIVGEKPSAYNLVLPEAYLSEDNSKRTEAINANMVSYLEKGFLQEVGECFVFVKRGTSSGVRKGLIVAFDLEEYNYSKGSQSQIRATEGTIVDRLPPRIAIRKNATLELPHIMVLIDDKNNELMELLEKAQATLPQLYSFDLMQKGGHIEGYKVAEEKLLLEIASILAQIKADGGDNFLYAMGDGNHSFAAAKECWELTKATLSPEEQKNHPARYCMAELVNLYDEALEFEPIHRLITKVDCKQLVADLAFDPANSPDAQIIQPKLDEWLKNHPEGEQEYIHGISECNTLAASENGLAIIFPPFEKNSLFSVVRNNGAFVRKSFSMGEADDKRFYLEARKIK